MEWLAFALKWYFFILIIGITFLPLTLKIFSNFFWDKGYALSKVIGIIILSYSAYVTGFFKVLSFSRTNIFILLSAFIAINYFIYRKEKHRFRLSKKDIYIFLLEEFLFFSSFIIWTAIRGQEPSIRSLEKFMDFGFINSILRSKYFPPLDIWLSSDPISPNGYFINYYYFGHLTSALLIKLSGILPSIGYNLMLSTLFALGISLGFSLSSNIVYITAKALNKKVSPKTLIILGLFSTLLLNLGGNLHTIYIFTKGYNAESPLPFWNKDVAYSLNEIFQIAKNFSFNPFSTIAYIIKNSNYWYPNATRFIPFTIHEFPSYSYVVADLHGHLLNIPYVLLTLALILLVFVNTKLLAKYKILPPLALGFLTAVLYMTNAFDGPIYFLFILFLLFFTRKLKIKDKIIFLLLLTSGFFIFSFPFASHFKPFVSGIGVNCGSYFTSLEKLGPFLFEKGNCQKSPFWMLFTLWGYFWLLFLLYLISLKFLPKKFTSQPIFNILSLGLLYAIFLIIIPEFFYVKDIYPAHFRANTMFKLGYQSFIISSLLSGTFLLLFKEYVPKNKIKLGLKVIFAFFSFLVFIYPFFSIPSYYGNLGKKPQLDGSLWLYSYYPEDKEVIDFLNKNVKGQPTILEAQGDSYTDYERISVYTGLPTVAGWLVHEWLWRGSPQYVTSRIPDIITIYETTDPQTALRLLKKYQVKYVIVSDLERQKYKNLSEEKFNKIGRKIFESSNKKARIYEIRTN